MIATLIAKKPMRLYVICVGKNKSVNSYIYSFPKNIISMVCYGNINWDIFYEDCPPSGNVVSETIGSTEIYSIYLKRFNRFFSFDLSVFDIIR
jgi:hypothetical protein